MFSISKQEYSISKLYECAYMNTSLQKMSNRVERECAYKVAKMKAFTSRNLSDSVG